MSDSESRFRHTLGELIDEYCRDEERIRTVYERITRRANDPGVTFEINQFSWWLNEFGGFSIGGFTIAELERKFP